MSLSELKSKFQSQGERDETARPVTYRFGPYFLDVQRRVLVRDRQVRPLPEKLFQILLLLLQADGRVVDKDTFFASIWPSGIPSEANLTQHMFMLRAFLGERARDHDYIVTVAGRGYRLAVQSEKKLGLAMKAACERCQALLPSDERALICSYECTFCDRCAEAMRFACPNCGGELVSRPLRRARVSELAIS
jgi:uncharacterized protein